ncbi:uncharacterized protein EV422DRAFT_123865 [Fimicolochytrium jonesii]|uniref:uncharacterized protein n=1 Tax=Fimicolochytrium jonesii TaxID=1396493 RepID=UPI0022FE29B0|nr:uncharacterized protein EV422DRAFT_123865 [Fimicolochytrium jonesii]KAI8818885.1 hypothetical protein EV422DRAFT_123865 [Fimicolochytrium jonesii]
MVRSTSPIRRSTSARSPHTRIGDRGVVFILVVRWWFGHRRFRHAVFEGDQMPTSARNPKCETTFSSASFSWHHAAIHCTNCKGRHNNQIRKNVYGRYMRERRRDLRCSPPYASNRVSPVEPRSLGRRKRTSTRRTHLNPAAYSPHITPQQHLLHLLVEASLPQTDACKCTSPAHYVPTTSPPPFLWISLPAFRARFARFRLMCPPARVPCPSIRRRHPSPRVKVLKTAVALPRVVRFKEGVLRSIRFRINMSSLSPFVLVHDVLCVMVILVNKMRPMFALGSRDAVCKLDSDHSGKRPSIFLNSAVFNVASRNVPSTRRKFSRVDTLDQHPTPHGHMGFPSS